MELTPIDTICFVVAYHESFSRMASDISKPHLQKVLQKNIAQTLPELKLEVEKGLTVTR